MTLRPEIEKFTASLEVFAGRKLRYKEEIGLLLDVAKSSGKIQVFEDIAFFAKFLSKSFDLMKRVGPDGEGYEKISAEFSASMEKSSALLKTLVKEAPGEVKEKILSEFFSMNQTGLSSMMNFLKEFAWVKNWMIDGKELP